MQKQKILFHICCAVCGVALLEKLMEKFEVILFYYNPNIYPEQEYEKRKESVSRMAQIYGVKFFEGRYDTENWMKIAEGKENEPEGESRCYNCFEIRLEQSALFAKENGIKIFTTSLFVSPFKDENQVNSVGIDIAKRNNIEYLPMEKIIENKKDNWQKTRELAKKYGFYFQKYCGCVFSLN